jgi:hemerythrin-like metal-binding protein
VTHFPWDPRLDTGDEMIDDQHRSLFVLANALQTTVLSDEADEDAVEDALYRLSDYCVEHFAEEEELMQAEGYPDLGPHQALHQTLTSRTLQMMTRYFNGADLKPDAVAPFVTSWLTEHIEKADMRFVEYLNESGR